MRFRYPIVLYFLAAGFLIPCLLYFVVSLGVTIPGWMQLTLWPAGILLAAGPEIDPTTAFLISAAANMFLYGVLGLAVSYCYRGLRRAGSR